MKKLITLLMFVAAMAGAQTTTNVTNITLITSMGDADYALVWTGRQVNVGAEVSRRAFGSNIAAMVRVSPFATNFAGFGSLSATGLNVTLSATIAEAITGRTVTASSITGATVVAQNTISGQVGATNVVAFEMQPTNLVNRGKGSWWASGSTNVQWVLRKNITLTNVVDVSACAYVPKTHTFWTIHNNNAGKITEWNLDGVQQRVILGTGSQCPDGESITYIKEWDKFATVDEDNNRVFVFGITNNASGSAWSTNDCQIIQLAVSIANDGTASGVEGLAWDQDRGGWWVAHEKTPAQLLFVSADGTTTNNPFSTAQMQTYTNSTHTDFSDLYYDRENQILWAAQDEGGAGQFDRVLAISTATNNYGTLLYTINTTNFGQLEGISVTPDGQLLLAGEANQFAIYEPVWGGGNMGVTWGPPLVVGGTSTNLPWAPTYPQASVPTNTAAFVFITSNLLTGQTYTNLAQRGYVQLTVSLTNVLAGDVSSMSLLIDQDANGTWETTNGPARINGVALSAGSEMLSGVLQPGALFTFTNQSAGVSPSATIIPGSCQWSRW